jgi:hypothetical protein
MVSGTARKKPAALKMLKYAFHGETDGVMGVSNLGVGGLSMFYETEESLEGKTAFMKSGSRTLPGSAANETTGKAVPDAQVRLTRVIWSLRVQ